MWSFTSRVKVSIMVVGIFLVVNASMVSFVAIFSEGWVVFIMVTVGSLAVALKEVPAGSAIKGVGNLVIPAVNL